MREPEKSLPVGRLSWPGGGLVLHVSMKLLLANVTHILQAIDRGDAASAAKLLPLVYEELRTLAARKLAGEAPGQTLEATALVHEAYLRLVGNNGRFANRAHFFAAAAEAMRRILIDAARHRQALRHGSDRRQVELQADDPLLAIQAPSVDVLALDEALAKLAGEDAVKAELVKLHFFAGLSLEEVAEALSLSRATAYRYWTYARAYLHHELHST